MPGVYLTPEGATQVFGKVSLDVHGIGSGMKEKRNSSEAAAAVQPFFSLNALKVYSSGSKTRGGGIRLQLTFRSIVSCQQI